MQDGNRCFLPPGVAAFYCLPLLWALMLLLPVDTRQWLYLDIDRVRAGEYWRFVSGHFVHSSWQHGVLNVIGLLLLRRLFPDYIRHGRWLLAAAFMLVIVGAGLLLFSEQLSWYVGFSGILTGLYIAAALEYFIRQRRVSSGVLLFVCVYTLAQQWQGELVSGLISDLPSASRAHLAGMVAGICWGLPMVWTNRGNRQ